MATGSNGASEAEEVSTCSEDNKISALNTKIYTDEEYKSLPMTEFPHETIEIKEEDLGKPDFHENAHIGPVIVNREDYNESQLEVSRKQLDISEQYLHEIEITRKQLDISEQYLHEEIKSPESNISEKTIVHKIHAEPLQENKCPFTNAVSDDEHKSCVYGMQVASSTAYDSGRPIGVWKHVISKSSSGKTNKVVRKDVDFQSIGCQSVGSRIVKTPYRKKSPLNWFPRKKTESYLERKIKMLQEAEGMMASLDETLVCSNIHLPRVEREKRAVQAAAKEAMETRKAKLVEASWCRILEAARIPCKLAAEELEKADKKASEALALAVALGVTMKNNPSSSKHSCESEGPSSEEGSNHAVTASFESAFEVEKEVAAAVKVAFGRLAHLPDTTLTDTLGDDEGKCRVKSQDAAGVPCNGDIEISEDLDKRTCFSEAKIQADCKLDREEDMSNSTKIKPEAIKATINSKISKELPSPRDVSEDLIGLMLERMKFLSTEELTSLEEIVSTRGLSALLKEQNVEENVKTNGCGLADVPLKPVSFLEAEKAAAFNSDLGSVLVRRTSRLEKELQEAKMSVRLKEHNKHPRELEQRGESLEQVLIKRVSRLEKEKLAAVANAKEFEARRTSVKSSKEDHSMPGLGDILRKQAPAMQNRRNVKGDIGNKENKDVKLTSKISSDVKQTDSSALKHEKGLAEIIETTADSCHETHIQSDLFSSDEHGSKISESRFHEHGRIREEQIEGLDKVLVRKMSRLEREKLAAAENAKEFEAQRTSVRSCKEDQSMPGLGDILRKQTPTMQNSRNVKGEIINKENKDIRLRCKTSSGVKQTSTGASKHENAIVETVKTAADNCDGTDINSDLSSSDEHGAKVSESRVHEHGKIRDKEQMEGLEKVLIKKLSRLEKEKLAATENAKQFETHRISRRSCKEDHSIPGLGEILRKQIPAMQNTRYVKGDIVNEENKDINQTSRISSGVKQTNIGALNHDGALVETVETVADNCDGTDILSDLFSSDEHVSKISESRFHEHGSIKEEQIEGLDKVLIKKLSRLEREKLAAAANPKEFEALRTSVGSCKEDHGMPSLGDILRKQTPAMQNKRNVKSDIVNIENKEVKQTSLTSKDIKLTSFTSKIVTKNNLKSMASSDVSEGQPQDRVKEMQIERKDVFNSEMIGFSPKSDAGIRASSTETSETSCTLNSQEMKDKHFSETEGNSYITETSESNPSLPVAMSMLEIEKQQAAALAAAENDPWQSQRNTRTKELQAVWGGLGLGDALKRHVSRLELEQAAWRKAEEEERRNRAP